MRRLLAAPELAPLAALLLVWLFFALVGGAPFRSPGGTTAEALKVLMDPAAGIQPIFDRAIAAATARSKALAG